MCVLWEWRGVFLHVFSKSTFCTLLIVMMAAKRFVMCELFAMFDDALYAAVRS
jgi:hypothetical protein